MSNNKKYALLEQGSIHTDDLSLKEAAEMLERHRRIFPEINWSITPMSEAKFKDRLKGFLEKTYNNKLQP